VLQEQRLAVVAHEVHQRRGAVNHDLAVARRAKQWR
jgi:hypothetical protein